MALTLILVRYCIFLPVFRQNNLELMPGWQFLFLLIATVSLGCGYIINDVLDIELDKVNSPISRSLEEESARKKGKAAF